ncbi:hypothetical protein F5884DRAFT_314988 [Xylogone sp. PMI_703]|nr:hypothetical protein F5884DRAFT_314988 [Xylogone sp. PMI_703]
MESVWLPHIRSSSDNWIGIRDPEERKRRQARLAQRARRARRAAVQHMESSICDSTLQDEQTPAEARLQLNARNRLSKAECQNAPSFQENAVTSLDNIDTSSSLWIGPALSSSGTKTYDHECLTAERVSEVVPLTTSPWSITMYCQTVTAALWTNADLLQLQCSSTQGVLFIDPADNKAPPSLWPTPLQGLVPHRAHLPDCIPFPSMRDRILEAGDLVQLEALREDILHAGIRFWGHRPWDTRSWEFPEQFVDKWWWLLDEEIIAMTNFWREERAVEPLIWKGKFPLA